MPRPSTLQISKFQLHVKETNKDKNKWVSGLYHTARQWLYSQAKMTHVHVFGIHNTTEIMSVTMGLYLYKVFQEVQKNRTYIHMNTALFKFSYILVFIQCTIYFLPSIKLFVLATDFRNILLLTDKNEETWRFFHTYFNGLRSHYFTNLLFSMYVASYVKGHTIRGIVEAKRLRNKTIW
jgi:hypothetical protein